jgi:thiol-disulfide isomerase/thioredoxin
MVERALIALALLLAFAIAYLAVREGLRARERRIVVRLNERRTTPSPGLDLGPRIVYFTTPTCVVCRLRQEPALELLVERLPELVLERYNALEERALASEYGVLAVPTTAVYDRSGHLVTINRGFAPATVLLSQIEGRDVAAEGGFALEGERLQER